MRKSKLTRKQKEHIAAYLFILPSFLGIAVFYIVPYIICFTKSLYVGDTFVGIENYIQLFQNNTFLLALKNTGIFTVVAIPLLMVISFLIALFFIAQLENEVITITPKSIASMTLIYLCGLNKKRVNIIKFYP